MNTEQNNKIDEARTLFGDFSGHLLDQEYDIDLSELTDDENQVIFAFGRLDTLELEDDSDDEPLYLEFGDKDAPLICSSYNGKQLYIVGGNFIIGEECNNLPVIALEYSTYRDNEFEQYRHEFAKEDLPLLNSDSDGEELFFENGLYTFTDKGIENK